AAQPALDAVRAEAISAHVRFLAGDLLEGRDTGSRGEAIARQYVIAQLQALGVEAELQPVHLLRVEAEGKVFAGDTELRPEIVAGNGAPAALNLEGALAFVGHGLAEDLREMDLRGKIAAVLSGAPPALPSTERALASSNEAKLERLLAAGAIAEIVL